MYGGLWYVHHRLLKQKPELTILAQVSRDRPYERCDECGSVYKMKYIGPPDDPHDHHHHHSYSEPKTMADYVKEDYWYR